MQQFPHFHSFNFIELKPLPYPTYEVDVVAVLDSVTQLFSNHFTNIERFPLTIICNDPNRPDPETIYELNSIYLCIDPFDENGQPSCYWSQFIYQFSHEFCHYMNFGHVIQKMRWFEECLCELASHFFLIQSFHTWQTSPPYETWKAYAPYLREYQVSATRHDAKFDITELSNESSFLRKSLESNEYNRDYNRHIALKMLPLFLQTPSLWKIVPSLVKMKENLSFHKNMLLLESESKTNLQDLLTIFGIVK